MDKAAVTRTKGHRGVPNARIVKYERTGPFYTQSGIRRIADQILPILHEWYEHRYLHATKGLRVYHGGKLFHLPSAVAGPQGWQLFKRSTWRPNAKERKIGAVPRFTSMLADGTLVPGKPCEMVRDEHKRLRFAAIKVDVPRLVMA